MSPLGGARPSATKAILTFLIAPMLVATTIATAAVAAIAMRPTIAEFIAQADAVCLRADKEIVALKIGGSMLSVQTFGAKLGATTAKTAAGLRTLDRPPSSDIGAAIDEMARAGSRAEALSQAAAGRDFPAAAKAAGQMSASFAAADDLSRQIGMRECGRTASRVASAGGQGAPSLLKGAYINDANALCRTSFAKDTGPEPTTLPELSASMTSLVAMGTKLNADLRAIAPPPNEKIAVAGVYQSFDALMASAKSLGAAADAVVASASRGPDEQTRAVADLDPRLLKFFEDLETANIKADQYGLTECGSGTQS